MRSPVGASARPVGTRRLATINRPTKGFQVKARPAYSDTHRRVLKRRRQWFERMAEAYSALWWIPAGHTPTTGEAEERVLYLREFGVTPYAFTLREHFPPPDVAGRGPLRSPEDWTCPA